MPDRTYSVLFICTGNSARSIFAEALLRDEGGDRFHVYSAGTRPQSELNPFAIEVLKRNGHEVDMLRAKHISEFQGGDAPELDFVFTVCDRAAEQCPVFPGQPMTAHWGLPDPAAVAGIEIEQKTAFQQTFTALDRRLSIFVNLPFESLDKLKLQAQLDEIGEVEPAADTGSADAR